jgi:hypothetical protein
LSFVASPLGLQDDSCLFLPQSIGFPGIFLPQSIGFPYGKPLTHSSLCNKDVHKRKNVVCVALESTPRSLDLTGC